MKQNPSYLRLNRLRVIKSGKAVYDQSFHDGINIIRGKNGSGKSTISDFIFYILGGEFNDWKEAARLCDEVQAEIATTRGTLTLKRAIGEKLTPIAVFFGSYTNAFSHGLEGWEYFPIRRQANHESFSQAIFRSIDIPEAKSEGASNITMHQLIRLCYSDQRSPATRIFRFESFDTPVIREAVGDLIIGVDGYELYETGLKLRELKKDLEQVRSTLNGLLKALPPDTALQTTELITTEIQDLSGEKHKLLEEISNVDSLIESTEVKQFIKDSQSAQTGLSKLRERLNTLELNISGIEYDLKEISQFQDFLEEALNKLNLAEQAFLTIGAVSFTHCPACGEALNSTHDLGHCSVCNKPTDIEKEKSYYNKVRLDLEIQIRESKQLKESKFKELTDDEANLRQLRQEYSRLQSEFQIRFSGGNGPREAFLAKRTARVGHIEAELTYLTRSLTIAHEIDRLNKHQSDLEELFNKLTQREDTLKRQVASRRNQALNSISDIGVSILHKDLEGRQDEFAEAKKMHIDFRDDAIFVDEKINFAESSNVYLKNTAILSLFLAAGEDIKFHHPRFLLLDNIEDKGMEVERSHLFQEIIVKTSTEITFPYQVIFTTSMMNPALELDEYTIGPAYSKAHRTLEFNLE